MSTESFGGPTVKRQAICSFPVVGLIVLAGVVTAWGQSATLIEFEIADQFDRLYRSTDYEGRIVYVLGSDGKGAKFNGAWGEAIYEELKDVVGFGDVAVLPLAHLKSVPFFLKGTIKKKFPQEKDHWVLMDWKGLFNKAYGLEPKSTNILIFSADGNLIHQAYGQEVDHEILDQLVETLRGLLEAS